MSLIYAMKENMGREDWGPQPVTIDQAMKLNQESDFGIFRAVNEFNGPRRILNLRKIRAWHVDMDGDKKEQLLLIKNSPIYASRIVESKNGFHLYFYSIDGSLENHREIMEGLNAYYKGDKRAKMVTALLREPGFDHKKDPNDPFRVREVFHNPEIRYTEGDMMYMFPVKKKVDTIMGRDYAIKHNINREGLTRFLDEIDNEAALMKLSGTSYVRGEEYSFKPVANGHKNILVNGRSTSCFIDGKKRIGATPGGPTVWQWLQYFGHDGRVIYNILKERIGGGL